MAVVIQKCRLIPNLNSVSGPYITIDPKASQSDWTAVPTRAEFTIECLPAFSRRDQAMFNIDDFVKGDLTKDKGMI